MINVVESKKLVLESNDFIAELEISERGDRKYIESFVIRPDNNEDCVVLSYNDPYKLYQLKELIEAALIRCNYIKE